jgi:hypothetical protein
LLLHAIVHSADIQDRDGGILLLATLFGMYPFLKKLFADAGYQGPHFQKALAKILPHLEAAHSNNRDHPFRRIATTCSDRSRPLWRGAPSGAFADLSVRGRRQARWRPSP